MEEGILGLFREIWQRCPPIWSWFSEWAALLYQHVYLINTAIAVTAFLLWYIFIHRTPSPDLSEGLDTVVRQNRGDGRGVVIIILERGPGG